MCAVCGGRICGGVRGRGIDGVFMCRFWLGVWGQCLDAGLGLDCRLLVSLGLMLCGEMTFLFTMGAVLLGSKDTCAFFLISLGHINESRFRYDGREWSA